MQLHVEKIWNASRICVSSLRRGHANLLCIVPILVYVMPKQTRLLIATTIGYRTGLLTLGLACGETHCRLIVIKNMNSEAYCKYFCTDRKALHLFSYFFASLLSLNIILSVFFFSISIWFLFWYNWATCVKTLSLMNFIVSNIKGN